MKIKKLQANGEIVTVGRIKGNISVGDKLYRISSKRLSDLAKSSYENTENIKISLNCTVTIKKDTPIKMELSTISKEINKDSIYQNIKLEVASTTVPIGALKTPISVERVVKQISKTNNTPYYFENVTVLLDDGLYVPSISSLNDLRRTALEKLEQEVTKKITRKSPSIKFKNIVNSNVSFEEHPKISLSLRNLYENYDYSKLDASKINRIYIALKLLVDKRYSNIINYLGANYDIYIYMPSIIKANYKNIILNYLDKITQKFNIKGFIISNLADFNFLERYKNDYDFIGNYSLNVFNNYTINEYKKLGLNTISLSRELNSKDLLQMINSANMNAELIVYGNLPVMATNYCFLGKTNKCNPECNAGCKENNIYYLKDRMGFEFKIIPDNFQTVTLIFNSKTISIDTTNLPISNVRVDVIDESIDDINNILQVVHNRKKLEGKDYTNGNLYREI